MDPLADPLVDHIGSRPQSFADDTSLASHIGLRRQVHQLTKVSDQPVLQTSEPWEGAWTAANAVVYDEQLGLWRMWYTSTRERQVNVLVGSRGSMHLAVSPDGIHWEKQPLGAYRAGGQETNLCVWEDGSPISGARTVFDEPDDPDPSRRYKLISYAPNYYLAYSADGIRWRPAQQDPVWSNGAGDGLEETSSFFKDPLSGKYRGYMRVWRRHQTIRKNALGESDDLRSWTGPRICWEASPHYGLGSQIYGMHVCADAGRYWALPWIFYSDESMDPHLRQSIRLKLATSLDGWDWHALAPEMDAVAMGRRGEGFDWGMMLASTITQTPHENRLYYLGCDGVHNGSDKFRAIGMAHWPAGRLVSLQADGDGILLTRRFLFRGQHLRINARTASDGYIQAELLSDGGSVLRTHTLDNSDRFTGDDLDHLLTWRGDADLGALYGQNLMLRLVLHKAEVFSFRADGPPERFTTPLGPPPVRIGRCRDTPVIDGQLGEDCWQDFDHAGVAADFVRYDRLECAPVQTRAIFTCDEQNLYVAVECQEPLSEQLPTTRPDGPVNYHREECFELRLSSPADGCGVHFHQFFVTVSGGTEHNRFSKEAGGLSGYLPDPWQAAVSIVPGRWVAEIAIPYSTLKTNAPQTGERWKMNIIRHRHLDGEDTTCWVCQFNSVHRVDLVGDLVFSLP